MACTKKTDKAAGDVTIIVTDSLQSLLPNSEVKAGKVALKTSWDGRVVFTAAQVGNNTTATISCEGYETKKINLNLQLVHYPLPCLEYVILHELCHIKVHGHGADFKALLDRYMPDWKARRKLLNG